MPGPLEPKSVPAHPRPSGATRRSAIGLILGAPLLGACAGVQNSFSNPFGSSEPGPSGPPLHYVIRRKSRVPAKGTTTR